MQCNIFINSKASKVVSWTSVTHGKYLEEPRLRNNFHLLERVSCPHPHWRHHWKLSLQLNNLQHTSSFPHKADYSLINVTVHLLDGNRHGQGELHNHSFHPKPDSLGTHTQWPLQHFGLLVHLSTIWDAGLLLLPDSQLLCSFLSFILAFKLAYSKVWLCYLSSYWFKWNHNYSELA